ncbi:LOW QUALITY PROTEIN: ATP-binding cassette sub-family C member 10 [Ambystoma mexicanum]|uniref:LOW QUALITY PROTEIN: ATP-binding cassette sub-family C member 10 n=1 Tax=Ambystoma mexicanum TaxID=8296 RepID=UPI0037E7622B
MDRLLPELCGSSPSDPLPVWDHGSIGQCFNQLVLNALPHLLLALTSACYVGTPRFPTSEDLLSSAWKCRIITSFLFAVLSVADIILTCVFLHRGTIALEVLVGGIATLAWITHGVALLKLYRSAYRISRGPLALAALVLLPVPALVITLMWYSKNGLASSPLEPGPISKLIIIGLQLTTVAAYLLAFLAPIPNHQGFGSINDPSERTPLLIDSAALVPDLGLFGEDGESWFSRFFYFWLNPLMKRGYQKKLNRPQDVYHLPRRLRTVTIRDHFNACWQAKAALSKQGPSSVIEDRGLGDDFPTATDDVMCTVSSPTGYHKEVRLLSVLNATFGVRYYSLGLLRLASGLLGFAGPLLLNLLVNFMETRQEPLSHGILYAFGLFISSFVGAVLRNQFTYEINKVMLMVRAAVVSAIYRKALRVNGTTLSHFSTGEIVNFMSTDTDRLINFCPSFHELWSLPVQFAVTLYLLYVQVGVAFLGGLGIALLLVPINKYIANRIMANNKEMLAHKDSRVKLMTEVLYGIRVIKFYTWEKHFTTKVSGFREKELKKLRALKYLDAVCVYLWAALPVVISILTFITYVLLGHELTAAKVFTALALVGMLILPLNNFPWVLNGILEAKVSLNRIQRFLELSDQDLGAYYSAAAPTDSESTLELHNATFSWVPPDLAAGNAHLHTEEQGRKGALEAAIQHLAVKKGSFVGVVGKVGCGKSSLLAAITGELNRKGGLVYISDREQGFGLASQEPWIQFATIRENILFGRGFNARFYQEVIEACTLTDDLNVLPAGDQTEVGENGVTLSGGQKARIALARAVYQDKEIYLLDDPLAAVDADVASHLLEKCILGILKHKTRILCTHRTEFLEKADTVVLMENGQVLQIGTPAEILPLVEATPKQRDKAGRKQEKASQEPGIEEEESSMEVECPEGLTLAAEEEKKEGAVAFLVYASYWKAVGSVLSASVLLALLFMQASRNVSDWWLSHWISNLQQKTGNASLSNLVSAGFSPQLLLFFPGGLLSPVTMAHSSDQNSSLDVDFYLTVYGGIAVANTIFTVLRAFLFAFGTIRAATVIHGKLLRRVLMATVTFFDTTPMGRIINRFSSDLYCIDDSLPFILNIFLANVFGLLGMVVMISYGLPWIILVMVPLAVLYFYIQRYYRHTSRELKRLYSITLSPIYTHFSETLTGLSTIRATRSTDRFEQENEERLERNQRCLYVSNTAMQWLDIRLQMIGVVVVTAIAVIAIAQHQKESGDPGLVGLALSYALSVTNLLSGLITSFTQTETMMVSVERAEEYSTDLPMEPQTEELQVSAGWPSQGHVEFRNAFLAYRPGLPNALDGVDFTFFPGERVGIVGRTGSGKSTIFLALFRMMELDRGQILIDNINTRLVGLEALRSKLAIIPQDPFLFSGSVRENLDPWGSHADDVLYQVLEQCHLKEVVTRMGGLDAEVGERGKSLSMGQRQLVCLARALLTQAKVLCIDEATASVDQKTDQVLQQTIRERFADKTVLTIAHRLNTIMDSDRVLVMHAGKVAELDSPRVLCDQPDSFFFHLIHSGAK